MYLSFACETTKNGFYRVPHVARLKLYPTFHLHPYTQHGCNLPSPRETVRSDLLSDTSMLDPAGLHTRIMVRVGSYRCRLRLNGRHVCMFCSTASAYFDVKKNRGKHSTLMNFPLPTGSFGFTVETNHGVRFNTGAEKK